MSFFAPTTKTVDLGSGNVVVLRKISFEQYAAAQSAATHIVGEALQLDWPRLRMEVLKRSVESWDGPGFDGQPPSAENVGALPWEVGNKLAEAAMELATAGTEAGN